MLKQYFTAEVLNNIKSNHKILEECLIKFFIDLYLKNVLQKMEKDGKVLIWLFWRSFWNFWKETFITLNTESLWLSQNK